MRRLMDIDKLGIAAVFAFNDHTHKQLEQALNMAAMELGADLIAAGNMVDLNKSRTELLFHPFETVADAKNFLGRAVDLAEHFVVDAPTAHTIFNGGSTIEHETDETREGGYLIIDGESVFVPGVTIRNFEETGKRFVEPRGVHPRPSDVTINKLVLHWTSSERDGKDGAEAVLRNMSNRRDAGCHFVVTNDGVVWQYADLVRDMTSHVSHRVVCPASIGFEVSCYGWVEDHSEVKGAGRDRHKYSTTIHKWRTRVADYFPAQHEAVQAVCTGICEHMGIPKDVMLNPWRVRSNRELRSFGGALGHLHCALGKNPKIDPGTRPLELLARHWGIL